MKMRQRLLGTSASVWMVVGMAVILTLVVVVLAVFNYNREVRYMEKVLGEKGEALIRSFEAGAKVGMMGNFGSENRLQDLIDATAELPDISYIILTDAKGNILAHNDASQIGETYLGEELISKVSPSDRAKWMVLDREEAGESFVVFKKFIALTGQGAHSMGAMMRHRMGGSSRMHRLGLLSKNQASSEGNPLIFIGLDMKPFIDARQADIKIMLTTSTVLLLIGLGCMVSLFWVQAYHRSRQQLKDSQTFATEIVSNLPIGLIVCGPEGEITHINKDGATLLGTSPANAMHQPAETILPSAVSTLVSTSEDSVGPTSKEILLGSEEDSIPVNAAAAEVRTEEGQHLGNIVILSDLTEIHRLQAEVKQREKLAAIGNLAAGVAHEVRNPLSSIKGYATYFAGLFDKESDNHKAAQVMIAETERLNRVITELLEFSRPSDFIKDSTDIAQVLDTVGRLLLPDAVSQGMKVTISAEPGLPYIQADGDRLVQAILNIGINGIQAMQTGGVLSLKASLTLDGITIEVTDTGAGISDEDLKTIFDPYFTTKTQGTGLGLAVVRKIIEGHGGVISVMSRKDEGTTFAVNLPKI